MRLFSSNTTFDSPMLRKCGKDGGAISNITFIYLIVLYKHFYVSARNIVTLGITNQRETTIVWDKTTGEPLHNAIVWGDIRTDTTVDTILAKLPENNTNHFKSICGLPISPYFSAFKLKWLMHYVSQVKKAVKAKKCLFGTVETHGYYGYWTLIPSYYKKNNLTGGKDGGLHITDVTNASRTFLMNIELLNWDPLLLHTFKVPPEIMPEIRSSSEIYGKVSKGYPLEGVLISGKNSVDIRKSAGIFSRTKLYEEGQAKNTYRSGCFLLYNTGTSRVQSTHGLVATVVYKFGDAPAVYALEAKLLNMKIICGLTAFSTKQHIIRAVLEAVCFQTRDILEAMNRDCGFPLSKLHVDGKMTTQHLLMQLQVSFYMLFSF
ncbi:hypothetical protein NQ317_014495 [Molorchus minor]|uniref:Glycerol kinase n=1 Tax=Molorchus minor TaxID=1323400 RepID=A0ABQ9IRW8_9CUCU|nr:hypothetical protein NQ317_014495 [Molorchus minor]